jgi:hypothetical protein
MIKARMIMLSVGLAISAVPALSQDTSMSFFITSQGSGDGANLGGLAGADAHCQKLAEAARISGKTWRAYLSTSTEKCQRPYWEWPLVQCQGGSRRDEPGRAS